eukprot:scaffold6793_cov188-Prasinococcus_capsulatus_cf.AAC.1
MMVMLMLMLMLRARGALPSPPLRELGRQPPQNLTSDGRASARVSTLTLERRPVSGLGFCGPLRDVQG